jgi:CRISPR-associated exonuclease Cas4
MILYTDDQLLMLSGIQHIAFCERQYALAYIEMQWVENFLTVEGKHLHQKVDDPFESEIIKGKHILRSLRLVSFSLGLSGIADIVEMQPCSSGNSYIPIEYKRGKPKAGNCDQVQLCAQALCLEEMYSVHIPAGQIYYGQTRHRHDVLFSDELRQTVERLSQRMHYLYNEQKTPLAGYLPHCRSCSLAQLCLPQALSGRKSAQSYLDTLFS